MPTQAELDAKKKEDQQSLVDSILHYLNPINWDFGDMFMLLLVGIGGFMLATSEKGKQFLRDHDMGGMADTLGEWSTKIKLGLGSLLDRFGFGDKSGLGLAAQLDGMNAADANKAMKIGKPDQATNIDIITKDEETWTKVKTTIKAANDGKLDLNLTNPKTILAFVTTKDAKMQGVTRDLLTAALANKPTPTADDIKAKTDMYATLRTLVKGDALNTLLLPENREQTKAILTQLSGGKPEAADKLLNNPLMVANNVATPLLRKTLDFKLTPIDDQGTLPSDKQVTAVVMQSDEVKSNTAIASGMVKQGIETIMGAKNTQLVSDKLGDHLTEFATIAASGDTAAIKAYAMQSKNLPKFVEIARSFDLTQVTEAERATFAPLLALNKLTTADLPRVSRMASKGVDPQELAEALGLNDIKSINPDLLMAKLSDDHLRAKLRTAGLHDVAGIFATLMDAQYRPYRDAMNEENLKIILAVEDRLNGNPANHVAANGDDGLNSAQRVLAAFMSYEFSNADDKKSGKNLDGLRALHPDEMAAFFRDPLNRQAFHYLVNLQGIPGREGQVLATLADNWGSDDPNDTKGFAGFLATKEGCAFAIDKIINPPNALMQLAARHSTDSSAQHFIEYDWLGNKKTDPVATHSVEIVKLMRALDYKDVQGNDGPTHTPRDAELVRNGRERPSA